MTKVLIPFGELEWISAAKGAQYKEYIQGDQKIRLVEFSEGFIEEDWCTKGHVGYVVEGSMNIDFDGKTVGYQKGDALWIEEGIEQQHKVLIGEGEWVLLVLFETT